MNDTPVRWATPMLDFGWNGHTQFILGWVLFCVATYLVVYSLVNRKAHKGK